MNFDQKQLLLNICDYNFHYCRHIYTSTRNNYFMIWNICELTRYWQMSEGKICFINYQLLNDISTRIQIYSRIKSKQYWWRLYNYIFIYIKWQSPNFSKPGQDIQITMLILWYANIWLNYIFNHIRNNIFVI